MAVLDGVKGEVTLCAPAWHDGTDNARAAYARAAERVMDALRSLDRQPSEPRVMGDDTQIGAPVSNFAKPDYLAAIETAKDYIRAGDIFQVVPSQRWRMDFPLPPFALYRSLRRTNPSPFMFFLNMGGFQIVGASPEILVRLRDGEVTIRPIAGTRPRGADEAQDRALEADLLSDQKELAEHLMLLDLGRNDVGRVAKPGTVRPTEQFVIERYSHVSAHSRPTLSESCGRARTRCPRCWRACLPGRCRARPRSARCRSSTSWSLKSGASMAVRSAISRPMARWTCASRCAPAHRQGQGAVYSGWRGRRL